MIEDLGSIFFELFTIGFHGSESKRSMDYFNYDQNKSKINVVRFHGMMHKIRRHGDSKIVNVYQKPKKVLDYMISQFSLQGE